MKIIFATAKYTKTRTCDRCKARFVVLAGHQRINTYAGNRLKYLCPNCAGFFLSRYTFLDIRGDILPEVYQWKDYYDVQALAVAGHC
jgi:hypothetical protein